MEFNDLNTEIDLAPCKSLLLGGFFLTTPTVIPKLAGVPSGGLLTVSKCLADFVPDDWVYLTSDNRQAEKMQRAKAFGVEAPDLEKLTKWCTSRFGEKQSLGWPNVIFDIETARELARQLSGGPARRLTLLGIGLPFGMSGQFFQQAKSDVRSSSHEEQGVPTVLQRGLMLPNGGEVLGFDALGYEREGAFHCSKCHGTENRELAEIGLNDFGYCTKLSDAILLCKIKATHTAEEIVWLPWEIRRYPL